MRSAATVAMAIALAVSACGGDASSADTTLPSPAAVPTTVPPPDTTEPPAEEAAVAPTTVPSGPPFLYQGSRGPWVAALQALLICSGQAGMDADGVFGERTAVAVANSQADAGRSLTGEPDRALFALLARQCERVEVVAVAGGGSVLVAGNVGGEDADRFLVEVEAGQVLRLSVEPMLSLTVEDPGGNALAADSGVIAYEIPVAGVAGVVVSAPVPADYLLEIALGPPGPGFVTGPHPEEDFDAAAWPGSAWPGPGAGGLVDAGGPEFCTGGPDGCVRHRIVVVGHPGVFSGSGADNPAPVMAWLVRYGTGWGDGEEPGEVVAALAFTAPIGDSVFDDCTPPGGSGPVVAYGDRLRGILTGAVGWDGAAGELSRVDPGRLVCRGPAGEPVAVGPGFG